MFLLSFIFRETFLMLPTKITPDVIILWLSLGLSNRDWNLYLSNHLSLLLNIKQIDRTQAHVEKKKHLKTNQTGSRNY